MGWTQIGVSGYGHLLLSCLSEIQHQASSGISAVEAAKSRHDNASVWSSLYLVALHGASLSAFLNLEKERRTNKGAVPPFPGRGQFLRNTTGITYDFSDITKIRHGIMHIDERFEHAWSSLPPDRGRRRALQVRGIGPLSEAGDRLLNWEPETGVLSFRREKEPGFDSVNLDDIQRAFYAAFVGASATLVRAENGTD